MKQLIREMGIPSSIRANVWMEISGAKLLKENSNINSESGCYYLDLVRKNELKKKHLEVYEYILKVQIYSFNSFMHLYICKCY